MTQGGADGAEKNADVTPGKTQDADTGAEAGGKPGKPPRVARSKAKAKTQPEAEAEPGAEPEAEAKSTSTAPGASPASDPADPAAPSAAPSADRLVAKALGDAMRDQKLRQDRMRHVQEFLTTPAFLDLRDQPVIVSDDSAALAARRSDLTYRITVLQSVLALLTEERDLLDRTIAGDNNSENGPDANGQG